MLRLMGTPQPMMTNQNDEPVSVAIYISAMTQELAQLAKRNGLAPLAYILDMARLEAEEVSKSATQRAS
jgi:hypothetical protein